jgi:hypothetical protein
VSASNSVDGAMLSPERTQMETFSGQFVDLLNPKSETINLADIAHHLAMQCRYNGAVKHFYSNAEHCCLVHDLMWSQGYRHELRLAAMLHDAAEAYLSDIVAPQKFAMRYEEQAMDAHYQGGWPPDGQRKCCYDSLTDRMDAAICEVFGIHPRLLNDPLVKQHDMWALKLEAAVLTESGGSNWRWPGRLPNGGEQPLGVHFVAGLDPYTAERWFVERVEVLL